MTKTEAYQDSLQFLGLTKKNGVGVGELYALKPTNNGGNFVWSRALSAYRTNQEGVMELVASGTPRVDYTNTCPELIIEKESTNIDKQSQTITNATWTKTAVTTSSTEVAPDGTSTAFAMTDNSAVAFLYFAQTVTISAATVYTRSYYIKKATSTPTFYSGIDIVSGANYVRAIINNYNGTAVTSTVGTATLVSCKFESVGDYYRVKITYSFASGTSSTYYVYPAISSNGTTTSAAAQGVNTFWGFQNELGYYATSYIPTTTASVTRPQDKAYNTTIAYGLKGTIFIRARIFSSTYTKVDTLFSLNDETLDDYITCSTNASRSIFITTMGGAIDTNSYNYSLASDGIYSIAIGYDFTGVNNKVNIAINGVLKRANAAQTNNPPVALSRFDLGSLYETLPSVDNRIIGQMYFADQLSDTDLTALTVQ
jgi:hypothetical protein